MYEYSYIYVFAQFANKLLRLLIPNLPSPVSLTNQHIETVFDCCALLAGFLQEECHFGIVNQVEAEVVGANGLVGNGRAGVSFG